MHIVKNELLSTDADAVKDNKNALFSPEKKYFVTAAHMPYIIENFRPSWLARPPTVGPNVKIPPKI